MSGELNQEEINKVRIVLNDYESDKKSRMNVPVLIKLHIDEDKEDREKLYEAREKEKQAKLDKDFLELRFQDSQKYATIEGLSRVEKKFDDKLAAHEARTSSLENDKREVNGFFKISKGLKEILMFVFGLVAAIVGGKIIK